MKPNRQGKYSKEKIIQAGYKIIENHHNGDNLFHATQIKIMCGVDMSPQERLKYCKGFAYRRDWRGYIPLFDLDEITQLIAEGKLISKWSE